MCLSAFITLQFNVDVNVNWIRDKLSGVELRQRLGIEDVAKVIQRNRLQLCGCF